MDTPPVIPQAAIDAAAADIYERTALPMHRTGHLARHAIAAALPYLLPGERVASVREDLTAMRDVLAEYGDGEHMGPAQVTHLREWASRLISRMEDLPAMQTPPRIPEVVLEAAVPALDRYTEMDALDVAHEVLARTLPILLPGLYVTRHDGDLRVARDNPDRPSRPEILDPPALAEALAALLPVRVED